MSQIDRIKTAAETATAFAERWVRGHYFSHIPDDAPEDFEEFLEKFENDEVPEAVLWEVFEDYAPAWVVEHMLTDRDNMAADLMSTFFPEMGFEI